MCAQPRTVCFGTDVSVPKTSTRHHTTAAFVCEGLTDLSYLSAWAAGEVLSSDVELFTIWNTVVKGCSFEDCDRIVIFTNSMAMARCAVDPSVHSGQAHSLAVCRHLSSWLKDHPERKIMFIETPSKLKWGIQHQVHLCTWDLPLIPLGVRPETLIDGVRKHIADSALNAWTMLSKDPDYLGHQFLQFRDPKGKPFCPTYANSGTWLKYVNEDNGLCARVCRGILNLALTGKYYRRFNIPGHETHECECGCPMQTWHHILIQCGVLYNLDQTPRFLHEFVGFLMDNPKAFALGFQYAHPREGDR